MVFIVGDWHFDNLRGTNLQIQVPNMQRDEVHWGSLNARHQCKSFLCKSSCIMALLSNSLLFTWHNEKIVDNKTTYKWNELSKMFWKWLFKKHFQLCECSSIVLKICHNMVCKNNSHKNLIFPLQWLHCYWVRSWAWHVCCT